MSVRSKLFPNTYRDSVTLMQLSAEISAREGVQLASAQMATPANLQLMVDAGLLETPPDNAAPNDLLFVVKGDDGVLDGVTADFETLLKGVDRKTVAREERPAGSIAEALQAAPDANWALVSVPGEYAFAEAMKALRLGLNVMVFSDNVPEAAEVELKRYADREGLIVMGPDCGTAIIGGVPLAFANVVAHGGIGVVGASGTGTQEITTLIDRLGEGVSHAIGTGGHDLSAAVGGLSMCAGIRLLAADPETRVIVLVSKPPSPAVAERVRAAAGEAGKPVVVCFLGHDGADLAEGFIAARTLEEAAYRAVAVLRGAPAEFVSAAADDPGVQQRAKPPASALAPGQKYLRGLYSGGTFCYEALLRLRGTLPGISANIPAEGIMPLANNWKSVGHTLVDLGDDEFTRGRPHPMIDPSLRMERLLSEAADPETAVILLDVVIGFGAAPDPAGELAQVVEKARALAAADGRTLIVIGFVCGTEKDPQSLSSQRQKLENAGLLLCESNAGAVALAGAILGSKP
ncbi:MAG: acyl-CoA synthetase FdrA [Methylobacteriaceae bacterium]|jgi:succinyl-CoA synthetase alpha subunit|nr:acyl-CoA synthetase FdrA [Methylobacteriaceae bacterium]